MNSIQKKALELYIKVTTKKYSKKGQSLAEYGLVLALVTVVCIGALTNLGTVIQAKLEEVGAGLG